MYGMLKIRKSESILNVGPNADKFPGRLYCNRFSSFKVQRSEFSKLSPIISYMDSLSPSTIGWRSYNCYVKLYIPFSGLLNSIFDSTAAFPSTNQRIVLFIARLIVCFLLLSHGTLKVKLKLLFLCLIFSTPSFNALEMAV